MTWSDGLGSARLGRLGIESYMTLAMSSAGFNFRLQRIEVPDATKPWGSWRMRGWTHTKPSYLVRPMKRSTTHLGSDIPQAEKGINLRSQALTPHSTTSFWMHHTRQGAFCFWRDVGKFVTRLPDPFWLPLRVPFFQLLDTVTGTSLR